jgi:aminoglycoside 3-N-acetyltransferase
MSCENPCIIEDVLDGLKAIGLKTGDCVIVHSSFKALGLNDKSPADVICSFIEFLGPSGTLVMPTFTYSCKGIWNVDPFNIEKTEGRLNGILSETLRKYPGSSRSAHPAYSISAIGKEALRLTEKKENASALGNGSSYEQCYQLNGKILLIGVGNERNSMLHYAEVAAGLPYNGIPFRQFWGITALVEKENGVIEVPLVPEFPGCSANFGIADNYLLKKGIIKRGKICNADSMLLNIRDMIDAVVIKLREQPSWLLCESFVCEPCTLRKKRLRELKLI